jgi:hypothetical protein
MQDGVVLEGIEETIRHMESSMSCLSACQSWATCPLKAMTFQPGILEVKKGCE